MSKNGKGFEKFLREQGPAKSQFFRAANKSPEEEAAYQAAQRAFDLQLQRQNATTQVVTQTYTVKDKYGNVLKDKDGKDVTKTYKERVPRTPKDDEIVPSEQEVEQAFETSRQKSAEVDEVARQNKRISPAYWVTNADFEQTFNRPYNPMSREDQRDFFQLVQNAPGATRRTDVAGADVGAVIPSTVRPTPAKKPSVEDLMKPQPGEMDPITGESDWDGRYLTRGQRERLEAEKSKEQQPKEPTKPSAPRTGISSSTPDWVLNARREDGSVSPRNLKDAEEIEAIRVGILASQPLPYSERQSNPLEDPTNLLKFVQQYAPETLTAAQKAALGMEGEYRRDLPYARRAAGLEGSPLPPSPPPAPDPAPAPEPQEQESSVVSDIEYAKMMQDAKKAPSSVGSSTFPGIPSSVASLIAMYKPKLAPDAIAGVDVEGPPRSEAERSKMMRDAREAPSVVGSSTFPGIPSSVASLIAAYSPAPAPAPEPAPAPDAIAGVDVEGPPRSEAERSKMMRDAQEELPKGFKSWSEYNDAILQQIAADEMSGSSEGLGAGVRSPSGFEQAMRLAQGAEQFAKNLVQVAGQQFKKGVKRVNAKAAEIQKGRQGDRRFDVGEKGFGQYSGPPLYEPGGGKWEWDEKMGTWSYNLGELPPTKLGPETELDISKAVLPPEPKTVPPQKTKQSGPRGQSLQPVKSGEDYYIFDQTTQDWVLIKGGKRTTAQSGTPQSPSFNAPQQRSAATAPQQVASAISASQQKSFSQPSPITQEIASRMLSVQTPGQVSTPLTGRDLTTQDRDRFKFDSAVPASVAASMNRVSPVRTPLGQEPLTQTEKPIAGGKKGEKEMASFTKGMSAAEINAEFEKIFGKEQRNLSIEIKKDMIERFRLGELMQEGGGIMGMNPMYEIEIDPDTGELKLNPKKRD